MASKLVISGLIVRTVIGAHAYEQAIIQTLSIDLSFPIDFSRAATTDLLSNTCDYAAVCKSVMQFAENTQHRLLETFTKKLSDHLKKQFQLSTLALSVTKKPKDLPNVSVRAVYNVGTDRIGCVEHAASDVLLS